MKYTPYPNYVRLSNPQELRILNKEEVEARDLKRAEDAKKQAEIILADAQNKRG